MSRLPIATLALAVLLPACGGGDASSADLTPLANQADRVAQLIDEGRGCDAVAAIGDLRELAQQDVPTDVRDTVVGFADSAEQAVTCEPTPTDAPPTFETPPPPPQPQDDEARPADEGEDDEDDKPGRGRGRGGDGDEDDSDD